jgi:hypothetical protein
MSSPIISRMFGAEFATPARPAAAIIPARIPVFINAVSDMKQLENLKLERRCL